VEKPFTHLKKTISKGIYPTELSSFMKGQTFHTIKREIITCAETTNV
jgi:hypothetical protein